MKKLDKQSRFKARWLANGWLEVVVVTAAGKRATRNEPPDGSVSVYEAAAALKRTPASLYKLIRVGDVKVIRCGTRVRVSVSEVVRLRRKKAA